MQPLQPKLESLYVFLADPVQIKNLFIFCMEPPFVVGRVRYMESRTDWDLLHQRRSIFSQVKDYNIVIELEKTLASYYEKDEAIIPIRHMAVFFQSERISKKPGMYVHYLAKAW